MDNRGQNNDQEIIEEIKKIIAKVARIDHAAIKTNASLREDLFIDSLQAIQITSLLETTYDIEIDEVDIFNVEDVSEIVDLIHEYLSEKENNQNKTSE